MSGEKHGPKSEPSVDTQALLAVSEADLRTARPKRAEKRGGKGPLVIAAGAGVLVLALGLYGLTRSRTPTVEVAPIEVPVGSEAPAPPPASAPASALPTLAPRSAEPSAPPPSPTPTSRAEPSEAASKPRAEPADRASKRKGGADLDRALERLSSQGTEAPPSAEDARATLGRDCDEGKVVGCLQLGQLVQGSDPAAAKEAFGKACRRRSAPGCLSLAELVEGREVNEALEAACDLASAEGCRKAAERIDSHGGSEARAIALRARACELGHKASCAPTKTSSSP